MWRAPGLHSISHSLVFSHTAGPRHSPENEVERENSMEPMLKVELKRLNIGQVSHSRELMERMLERQDEVGRRGKKGEPSVAGHYVLQGHFAPQGQLHRPLPPAAGVHTDVSFMHSNSAVAVKVTRGCIT